MNALEDRVRLLFFAAVERDAAEWSAFLDEACADNAELRARLEQLLGSHQQMGSIPGQSGTDAADRDDLGTYPLSARAGRSFAFLRPPTEPGDLGELGPFRIRRLLGRGGMGIVFLALDRALAREVALKILPPEASQDSIARQRFLHEGRAMAALHCDQIVTLYRADEDNGVAYLAMELLQGQSLEAVLKGGSSLSVAEVVDIAHDVALGLASAHEAGLIHRDIKPGNLWLEQPSGRVKILDFGLAQATLVNPQLTQAGTIVGTPSYMAPEQGRRQPLDGRCDLFSLGVVLYRLLTGRLPFEGDSTMQLLTALATHNPMPPRAVVPSVPSSLSNLVLKLLEKEPSQRPASAQQVVAILQQIKQGEPSSQTDATENLNSLSPVTPAASGGRSVLWSRWGALLGTIVVTALLWAWWPPHRPQPEQPQPELFLGVEKLALVAGETRAVEVVVKRRGQTGALTVQCERLPEQVGAPAVVLAESENLARLQVTASKEAVVSQTEVDVAVFQEGRKLGEQRFLLTIAALPLPQLKPLESDTYMLQGGKRKSLTFPVDRRGRQELLQVRIEGLPVQIQQSSEDGVGVDNVSLRLNVPLDQEAVTKEGRLVLLLEGKKVHERQVTLRIEPGLLAKGGKIDLGSQETMTFVRVPKGTFWMSQEFKNAQRQVTIAEDFELAIYPVTQGQWRALMADNPSSFSRTGKQKDKVADLGEEELKQLPVETVSWNEAQQFLKKLNEQQRETGFVYRLPSEAEWEYACRARATSKDDGSFDFYYSKPTNTASSDLANFNGTVHALKGSMGKYLGRTSKVGAYPPNALGLYDMHGNVLQWTSTRHSGCYMLRGGSWDSAGVHCRAAQWSTRAANYVLNCLGFRVARSPAP